MPIHIVTVNWNSENYVMALYESVSSKAQKEFVFNVCDNGSESYSLKALARLSKTHSNVRLHYRQQGDEAKGAIHHANAVELILSRLTDDDYVLVIDVDCYMLKMHWDKWMLKIIDKCKSECLCTVKNFGSEDNKNIRAMPFLAFFRLDSIRKRQISFMPDMDNLSKERDFGYELNKIPNIVPINIISPAPSLHGLPKGLTKQSMDFVYNGEIIAHHMKTGGRWGFKSDHFGEWLDRCRSLDTHK